MINKIRGFGGSGGCNLVIKITNREMRWRKREREIFKVKGF